MFLVVVVVSGLHNSGDWFTRLRDTVCVYVCVCIYECGWSSTNTIWTQACSKAKPQPNKNHHHRVFFCAKPYKGFCAVGKSRDLWVSLKSKTPLWTATSTDIVCLVISLTFFVFTLIHEYFGSITIEIDVYIYKLKLISGFPCQQLYAFAGRRKHSLIAQTKFTRSIIHSRSIFRNH